MRVGVCELGDADCAVETLDDEECCDEDYG